MNTSFATTQHASEVSPSHRGTTPTVSHRAMGARTLDDLANLPFWDLERLYRGAPAPESLTALDGAPIGRMLAVRGVSLRAVATPLREFARSNSFVWEGKSFASTEEQRGRGINRVRVAGVLGRQNLFPFETHIGMSSVDGRAAIVLDYGLAENPGYIRKIHDEVREIAPGLYLGPAMWKGERERTTLLFFALDTRARKIK